MINKFYTKTGGDAYSHRGAIQQLPEITVAERDALTPQEGWIARVDTFGLQYYNGTGWVTFPVGIIDTLVSTSVIDALSANQGKQLQDTKIPTADIINDLTTGGATKVLSAEQGVELKDQLDAKGKVLQVVSATTSSSVTVVTTTFTDTGLTATITPISATSNIIALITQPFFVSKDNNVSRMATRLMRDSVEIYKPYGSGNVSYGFQANITISSTNFSGVTSIAHEDKARAEGTSAIIYKTQGRVQSTVDSESVVFQFLSSQSSIILMEIE